MINYLNRTQARPSISNPLPGGRSLSSFSISGNSAFAEALRHCRGQNTVLNNAISQIQLEIQGMEAWSQWALDNSAVQYGTLHTVAERNALIASLEGLLATPPGTPVGTPATPGIARTPGFLNTAAPAAPTAARTNIHRAPNVTNMRNGPRVNLAATFAAVGQAQPQQNELVAQQRIIDRFLLINNITDLTNDPTFMRLDPDFRNEILRQWYRVPGHAEKSRSADELSHASKRLKSLKSNSLSSNSNRRINETCNIKFSNAFDESSTVNRTFFASEEGKKYKKVINKLRRVCNRFVSKDGCNLESLDDKYVELATRCPNKQTHRVQIRQTETENILLNAYKAYVTYPKVYTRKLENFRVQYLDAHGNVDGNLGVDGGGLGRDYAQKLSEKLLTEKLFVPIEESDTNQTYMFNSKLDISKFTRTDGKPVTLESVFEFAGALVSWLMINGIKCRFAFNKGIIAQMIYKPEELDLDDYIVLFLLDNPENESVLIEGLKNPSKLEETLKYEGDDEDYGFKGQIKNLHAQFKSRDSQLSVKAPNYRKFMGEYSKYRMLGYVDDAGTKDANKIATAFYKGFIVGRRWLLNRNYTVQQLDVLLSAKELDETVIEELIKYIKIKSKAFIRAISNGELVKLNSISSSEKPGNSETTKLRKYYKKVLNAFFKIFRQEIPYEPIKAKLEATYFKPEDQEFIPADWNTFMAHLFHYWTGIKNYFIDKSSLTDDIEENSVYSITLTGQNTVVESHTCFYNIQVPLNIKAISPFTFEQQIFYLMCESMVLDKKINGSSFSMA